MRPRSAPTALAEARAYAGLVDEGLTVDQVATQVGRRARIVRERLALLTLTEDTLSRLRDGRLTVAAALAAVRAAGDGRLPDYRPSPRPAPASAQPSEAQPAATRPVLAETGWFTADHPLAVQATQACRQAHQAHDGAGAEACAVACEPCRLAAARAAAAPTMPLAGGAARAAVSAFLWLAARDGRTEIGRTDLDAFRVALGRGPAWLARTVPALVTGGELLARTDPTRYGLPHHPNPNPDGVDDVVAVDSLSGAHA